MKTIDLSNDLVAQNSDPVDRHTTASLRASARGCLGPDWPSSLIQLDVGAFEVPAKHVMTLSMALQVLMTNAAKHGALSSPAGRIRIELEQTDTMITLFWSKHDGPPPRSGAGKNKGFGSTLLENILPAELKGKATQSIDPAGMRYLVTFPPFAEAGS